mgnify:CR=1 FL=1
MALRWRAALGSLGQRVRPANGAGSGGQHAIGTGVIGGMQVTHVDASKTAIATMKEDGIDISEHTSNNVLEYKDIDFDYVITVCDHAKEVCPYFPSNAEKLHHNFPDPSKLNGTEEEIHAEFVRVREMIKSYCSEFVKSHS